MAQFEGRDDGTLRVDCDFPGGNIIVDGMRPGCRRGRPMVGSGR